MDLRAYYQKLHDTETKMPSPQTVMVSLATPDGGKAGVVTEAPTPIAARMVVEGRARQATAAEIQEFRSQETAARQHAEQAAAANKLQVVVLPAGTQTVLPSPTTGIEK
jgi:hypothetical protein